jgi:hypothetical protein
LGFHVLQQPPLHPRLDHLLPPCRGLVPSELFKEFVSPLSLSHPLSLHPPICESGANKQPRREPNIPPIRHRVLRSSSCIHLLLDSMVRKDLRINYLLHGRSSKQVSFLSILVTNTDSQTPSSSIWYPILWGPSQSRKRLCDRSRRSSRCCICYCEG